MPTSTDTNYEIISEEFSNKYKDKKPNWGFNGLGYIVYKRTYSRIMPDGRNEEWHETVRRCINGAQKIGAKYTKEEAERLFDLVFNLKCNFAGRMLWQLGTSTVDRFGLASLLNCWFVSMKEPEDFCFLFEHLMLGGGVGYSVKKEDIHELPKVKSGVLVKHNNSKDADFIVPDSRQGWVNLLRNVLNAFFVTGKSFSYSTILIRGAGEPIKGFGGTASGPKILVDGMESICKIVKAREGKKLRSIDVLDINNIIGSIVVAGNVRRSAEVAIGDPDDYLYLRAKRWDLGNIPNWRAMSNNSIYADSFDQISDDVWSGYNGGGEPYGFMNLPLAKKYGRLGEEKKDNCEGGNPCVIGSTIIPTFNGFKEISECLGKQKIWNGYRWYEVEVKVTGHNQPCLKVTLNDGKSLTCTNYHKWYVSDSNGNKVEKTTNELKAGDELFFNTGPCQQKITSVESAGIYSDVYCFNEPNEHLGMFNGIITGQCMEITLADGEACNLCELYLNNITSKEELIDCAKLLYKTQKAVWNLPALYDKTTRVVSKNRRIGLGVTGVCQSQDKLEWLDECYRELRKFDEEWSKANHIPVSIKLSTVKPSGTLSLLGGATPGVHPAYAKYYIRRVRMSSTDKLLQICKDAGYHVESVINYDNSVDHSTSIVSFPCKAGEGTVLAKDMTAVAQLELVKKMQTIWADNSVSVTVYYKLEELKDIKTWLKENYENSLKTVSFLLHSQHGFKQAPYEEITEKEYLAMSAKIKDIKSDISSESTLDGVECAGGACPIR